MRLAYLDCFSGISGNMFLGALLRAGLAEDDLKGLLAALPLRGYRLQVEQVCRGGLSAALVEVLLEEEQPLRHLADIRVLLHSATLDKVVRDRSLAVFTRLAEAEAEVHGVGLEEVHFHEVGALDALVDVVGTVGGLQLLGVERLVSSPLPLSRGWTRCAHGEIPLPAPAVCALLRDAPVYGVEIEEELVTPTGAALVCTLADEYGPMPAMTLERSAYGAGSHQRGDGRPNLLRLCLGREQRVAEAAEVEILETHLDDWNPEFWPHLSALLMESGALDVSLTPIQMKKGRPGFRLSVICEPHLALSCKELLLAETSAIGLRFQRQQRLTLPRRQVMVESPWGPVPVKEISALNGGHHCTPEYEACREVAARVGLPLQEVYAAVLSAARAGNFHKSTAAAPSENHG